ncbi:hypothetical protein ACFWN7_09385 [Agromyces sp. NPDC058484]|uniref:hypothetical protein n=1 Tax=Agromyces sp. NPDC058484 TaxID=3346524 RepID=UPI0036489B8D
MRCAAWSIGMSARHGKKSVEICYVTLTCQSTCHFCQASNDELLGSDQKLARFVEIIGRLLYRHQDDAA